jgi:hypothetical protein
MPDTATTVGASDDRTTQQPRRSDGETTADQTTQTAGGVTAVEGTGAPAIRPREDEVEDDDLIARNSEDARATPRRYDSGRG